MDLSTLRNEIDRIDSQLAQLYEQRMEICSQVAEYKIENGKKVFDKTREEEKLARVRSLTHNDFNSQGVTELFEQIMAMSRKLQYQMLESHGRTGRLPFIPVENLDTKKARVVFQGAEGAYSQAAMMRFFGERIDSIHVDSFRDAMSAIEEGSAEFAVLPIENSTAGIVSEIYDLLVEFENYIVGEQILKIEHCLLGVPGTKISDIQTVYSHPQSLMQSSRFLGGHSWQQISMPNNAFAARKVAEDRLKTQAAIASEYAGKVYGLEVLQKLRSWSDVPVIIISARTKEQEKVSALDLGADDYITKPFGTGELMARIRTSLRHSHAQTPGHVYKALDLEIDFEKRLIRLRGEEVHLTQIEYQLLTLLAENSGRVLTYSYIMNAIWGPYMDNNNQILRVNMANIRRKLEQNPAQPQYVFTEIGVGYRMRENENGGTV